MRTTASRGLLAICLSISIQAYVLYYAYNYGTLRGLLQWDDCGVIFRGFENLDLLAHAKSIWGVFLAVRHFDIHAPLSDTQTMVGLLLSGGQIWGPYLLNAGWLALVLFAILTTIDPQNWPLTAATALFVLVQPVTISALSYVKSDWQGGLLLTGALFLLNAGVERARPDLKLFAATLLGLSILSKLTAFYLPVLALWILVSFEWHSAALLARQRFALARFDTSKTSSAGFILVPTHRRMFAFCAAIAVCPFFLFFVYKRKSTVNYIHYAISSRWDDELTNIERARYYSPLGHYSWGLWGTVHFSFLIFVGAALWVAWRRRDLVYPVSLSILALIGMLFFIPLIVSHSSNISFAATFLGVIMATTLISMASIARSLPRWGSLAILAVTVLVALPETLPFQRTAYYSNFPIGDDELRQLADTYARIVDTMAEHARLETPDIVVCYDHVFAPHPNLAIEYFRKTGHFPILHRVDDLSNVGVTSEIANADFVLTIVPSSKQSAQIMPGLYPAYPVSRDPARADVVVHTLSRFDLIGTFAVHGGEIHLYGTMAPTTKRT